MFNFFSLNPLTYGISFCPLLEISLGNPYLKNIDILELFVADAPMKKNVLLPLRAL